MGAFLNERRPFPRMITKKDAERPSESHGGVNMLLKNTTLPKRACNALEKKNISTVNDLACHFPRQYRDYTSIVRIKEAKPGVYAAFSGKMTYCDKRMGARWYLVMRFEEPNGEQFRVMMFSKTFMFNEYNALCGANVVVCGELSYDEQYGYSVNNPDLIVDKDSFRPFINTIYPQIKGVSDKSLREYIDLCIGAMADPVYKHIKHTSLDAYGDALRKIHHPTTIKDVIEGRRRALLNDMLYLSFAYTSDGLDPGKDGLVFRNRKKMNRLVNDLPYAMTKDQKDVLEHFCALAAAGSRINALLQGDVGCGKTIVAICMAVLAAENGFQSMIVAPREVLAEQHYRECRRICSNYGINVAFLHAGIKARERSQVLEQVSDGTVNIIVGTHSCLSDEVKCKNLGLVITDEEHLFGVDQKESLRSKANDGAHCVAMSATPIPKTLAGIFYGNNKEICSIHTMPEGRKQTKTVAYRKRDKVFDLMMHEIAAGHQCYVVCPAIEESDDIVSIDEVEEIYERYFAPNNIQIGVLNGKMKKEEIEKAISDFEDNTTQILISTTVIEVGVNIPNSTVMVIEQADRFGLASLHQLRGRVGRSSLQSYCVLLSEDVYNERLRIMQECSDGFRIAEEDLKLRGAGDIIGSRQSGMNRYLDEMVKYPKIYEYANKMATICAEDEKKQFLAMYASG